MIDREQVVNADDSRTANFDFWKMLSVLFARRSLIAGITVAAAVISVIVALLLPKWYLSSARLVLPESGAGSLSSVFLGDLSSAARSLLGSSAGEYTRYLSILTSRSLMEEVVDSFNLVDVYDLNDSETAHEDAVDLLRELSAFEIDDEYDFLTVSVLDRDPQRAAEMANYFARRLNIRNAELASENMYGFRAYAEARYERALADHDTLLASLETFQRRYGVFHVEAQTESFFRQLADLRGRALELEIQYEALRRELGNDNSRVRALKYTVDASAQKYREILGGSERLLPVPTDSLPLMVREYASLELERLIQERIVEVIAPVVEQARFSERSDSDALQVVDEAVPSKLKARPQRTLIVIVTTLSSFLIVVVFVLLLDWWSRVSQTVWRRIFHDSRAPDATLP